MPLFPESDPEKMTNSNALLAHPPEFSFGIGSVFAVDFDNFYRQHFRRFHAF